MALPSVSPNPFPFLCLSLHLCFRASSFSASLVVISFALGVGQNRPELFFEDLLCIRFNLAKGYRLETAVLRSYREATNTAEEV